MTVDHAFPPPSGLRRVKQTDGGARLYVDTDDHDLSLLRSIADAVAADEEMVGALVRYSEAMERRERAGRYDDQREERAAEREAADLRDEIDALLSGDQTIGEGLVLTISKPQVEELAAVAVRITADQIEAETGIVREIHRQQFNATGGAA